MLKYCLKGGCRGDWFPAKNGMNFIIGQVISIVVLIISVIVVQFKNIKYILIGEIIMNLLVALSFVFLGGLSGAWICIVATVQTLIMYLVNRREIASWKRTALMVVFVAAYIIGTVIVYQGWSDIVSCVCAMLYVLAVVQKDASKYRIFMNGFKPSCFPNILIRFFYYYKIFFNKSEV